MADFDLDFEVARDRLAEASGLEPTPRPLTVPRDAKWEAWRRYFAAEQDRRDSVDLDGAREWLATSDEEVPS